jgi:4-amino-4-deoxy-L-arabinose transferase-like glycosyltransferase
MDRKKRTFWRWASAALVAGLLLRLWCVVHLPLIDGDSFIYGGIAKNWLQRGVYGFNQGNTPNSIDPTLIRLPGYPIFLAACFRLFGMEHYRAVMLVQVGADLVTCWLASALAGRLFGRRAALVVLWLAALCPFTATYVAAPLTETLVLTTIALSFYGFARWEEAGLGYNRWLWVVAAAVAWSILLRPEQGLLAAAVVPAMLWRSLATPDRRSRLVSSAMPAAAAALLALLPLIPWTIRNWNTFHVFQPLVPKYATDPGEVQPIGFGRWYRTWGIEFASTEDIYWNYDGDRMEFASLPPRAFDDGSPSGSGSNSLRDRTAALFDDYNVTMLATQGIDDRFAALADERIHTHPILYYFGLPVARLLDMTLRPRTEMMDIPLDWWRWSQYRAKTAFAAAYAALNLAYIAVGLAGFCLWRRRRWLSLALDASGQRPFRELAFAMAATLILRSALLLTLDNSEPRYTLEFFPVLFVWAGALFAVPTLPESGSEPGRR